MRISLPNSIDDAADDSGVISVIQDREFDVRTKHGSTTDLHPVASLDQHPPAKYSGP